MSPTENGSAMPLRPALKEEQPTSPKSGPVKVVSIADETEEIETPPHSAASTDDLSRPKQFRAGVADKRMTGRPGFPSGSSGSRLSVLSLASVEESAQDSGSSAAGEGSPKHGKEHRRHHPHLHFPGHGNKNEGEREHHTEKLLSQVAEWLQAEKAKHVARKSKRKGDNDDKAQSEDEVQSSRQRTNSASSDSSSISLEKLQRILEDNISVFRHEKLPLVSPSMRPQMPGRNRRKSSARRLGAYSSDTEYQDGDVIVPSCDVVLDNSKTMSYSGGAAESSNETVTMSTSRRAEKERKAWLNFKNEIVRLAHTLRLKGWRRVPLERGGEIEVERLSGALTNAVYVVSPPKDLPLSPTRAASTTLVTSNPGPTKPYSGRPPPKLLLRIYGPRVEHLIDRENELSILRRLARKKIGPRLLGTFTNGRFEEFFNAQTLTAEDLRVEDTSKQIAKRMRELHDGIDLLDTEREEGPFVFQNWDKWVNRCEEVISYLDREVLSGSKGKGESWRKRGLICGVEWRIFKATVDKYRKWLYEYYGENGLRNRLVFAHNDTQYGNILRLVPEAPADGSAPSPLLLPANHHKQLVVIDFEYASANTPGLEFANHFTEWCCNYHDPAKPWRCNTDNYPTLEQQTRFIKSYVNHRPQFNPRASATPKLSAMDGMAAGRNSISDFYLDSRTPGGGSSSTLDLANGYDYSQEEAQRERETEKQVAALLHETRIWRVANSAQWVAWGIVQAKIPELDGTPESPITDGGDDPREFVDKRPDGFKAEALLAGETVKEAEGVEDQEDEFDYLAYAQDRAMFFWGDVVGLGLVGKEDLPEDVRGRLKIVAC